MHKRHEQFRFYILSPKLLYWPNRLRIPNPDVGPQLARLLGEWLLGPSGASVRRPLCDEAVRLLDAFIAGHFLFLILNFSIITRQLLQEQD